MAEIDDRVRRVRRVGVVLFLAMAALAVPLGLHIKRTWPSPELGLTLLGAVLLLVLICLFAMETAVTRIPEPMTTGEDAEGRDLDPTELMEPVSPTTISAPPTTLDAPEPPMADLATELDLSQQMTANPDGPMLVVPNPALAHAETRLSDTEIDEGEPS
jgi:hypothetical protein